MAKGSNDVTVPFFKVPSRDRERALQAMRTITNGDKDKLDTEIVKTAFKSLCGSDSKIAGVPRVEVGQYGPTFRIPLKGSQVPAFASLQQIKSML